MYKIACLMGKSSSGKDTIYKALLNDEKLKLKKVVMYTTRPMREGEQEGVEYHFTDEKYLEYLSHENKIIEQRTYNTVHGPWHYFTADDGQIDLENGRYLIIGTLEAYSMYVRYYGKDIVMPIYIEVEDGVRLERALLREKQQPEPKYREMCRRFIADCDDFSEEKLTEQGITKRYYNNSEISLCIEEIKQDLKLLM